MPAPYPPVPAQLETALLIQLRNSLRWESSVAPVTASGTFSGTLTSVNTESQSFDALQYQRRDRELAWLDTRSAAAIVEVSLEIADVWNASALRPRLEGPQVGHLSFAGHDVSPDGMISRVVHVKNASIPAEALRVDRDLAGRDILIYETLYNAVRNLFNPPPITSSGASVAEVTAWSYAQGTAAQADINLALPLDRDLFKTPDMNLADRDNQMAAYVSQLCQVLKNPFAYADRLYVAVYGIDPREVETYSFIQQPFEAGTTYLEGDEVYRDGVIYRVKAGIGSTSDVPWQSPWAWETVTTAAKRIWTCEPALPGRNRFVYNTETQTIQWFRESADVQHIPQLVALSVPGIFSGQTLSVLAQIPERKDGQFWRNKAAHVVPSGGTVSDLYSLETLASSVQQGFTIQTSGASLPIPGMGTVWFPDPLSGAYPQNIPPGNYRIAALIEPNSTVELAGGQNDQGTGGIDGGATFSGFSQLTYSIGLPPTQWTIELDYTNLSGSTSGFRLVVQLDGATVFDDTAPLYFNDSEGEPLVNGTIVTSAPFPLLPTGQAQVLSVAWTGGSGQLHIRRIRFKSSAFESGRFRVSGTLAGQTAVADVIGEDAVPGVVNWDFTVPVTSPDDFSVNFERDAQLPLRIFRMDLAQVGTNAATPNAQGFENYRHDCLVRAVRSARQAFSESYYAGTTAGTFLSEGTIWDEFATDRWLATIEMAEPRLRQINNIEPDGIQSGRQYYVAAGSLIYEGYGYGTGKEKYFYGNVDTTYVWASTGQVNQVGAWQKAKATHNGKPVLAPAGVYFDYAFGTATAAYAPDQTVPELATCQPWMIELGFHVAQPEFWLPTNL